MGEEALGLGLLVEGLQLAGVAVELSLRPQLIFLGEDLEDRLRGIPVELAVLRVRVPLLEVEEVVEVNRQIGGDVEVALREQQQPDGPGHLRLRQRDHEVLRDPFAVGEARGVERPLPLEQVLVPVEEHEVQPVPLGIGAEVVARLGEEALRQQRGHPQPDARLGDRDHGVEHARPPSQIDADGDLVHLVFEDGAHRLQPHAE